LTRDKKNIIVIVIVIAMVKTQLAQLWNESLFLFLFLLNYCFFFINFFSYLWRYVISKTFFTFFFPFFLSYPISLLKGGGMSWYSLTPYSLLYLFLFFPLIPGPFFPHYRGEGQLTIVACFFFIIRLDYYNNRFK
jgi:hypothetical protein